MSHTISRLWSQRRFRKILVILLTFSLLIGVFIVPVEKGHSEATITNYYDGLYWAVTTITTVGYGDMVPLTQTGKALSVLLQLFGVVMFGSVIAMISTSLTRYRNEYYLTKIMSQLDRIEKRIDRLEKESSFLIKEKNQPK